MSFKCPGYFLSFLTADAGAGPQVRLQRNATPIARLLYERLVHTYLRQLLDMDLTRFLSGLGSWPISPTPPQRRDMVLGVVIVRSHTLEAKNQELLLDHTLKGNLKQSVKHSKLAYVTIFLGIRPQAVLWSRSILARLRLVKMAAPATAPALALQTTICC